MEEIVNALKIIKRYVQKMTRVINVHFIVIGQKGVECRKDLTVLE